ncbi:UV-damaged DNA-binding protein rad7, partial [Coemansia sp. RSA 2618]
MDPNDRARGSSAGRAAGKGGGTVIRGPNSALTDYLQEIGVTEHFRERRRREAEERVRVEANGAGAGAGVQAGAEARVGAGAEAGVENAEAGADEAEARNDEARNDEAGNDEAGNEDAEQPEAGPSTQAIKTIKTKGKRKKKAESDGEYRDEKDEHGGLNRSSARKGGKMHDCGMCGRRFLVRGGAPAGRVLCAACRRSVDKAGAAEAADAASVARRAARVGAGPVKQRKRMRKTEGGLLEFDAGLPLLQDLCVRAIARHLDRVDTFGDVSGPSLDRLSRIVSKMRVLDGRTLGLFVGAGRTAVALYDCTLVGAGALAGIASASPRLERLDLRFCGRLDGAALLALGRGLARLAHVRLDGAFLVRDAEWAAFFRAAGARLRTFSAAFAGFGAAAMRALVTHGVGVEALRLAECSAFDDDCLAMLAAPITEYEETAQEAERVLRAAAGKGKQALGAVPAWQPLAQLRSLELQRPHHAMSEMTARRVVRALGAQLRVLD